MLVCKKKFWQKFDRISRNSVISVVAEIFAIPKLKTLEPGYRLSMPERVVAWMK